MPEGQNQPSLEMDVRQLVAAALQLDIDQVSPELSFGDLPQWDSMGHMEVMMNLEVRFGLEVSADTISALTTIPAICQFLEEME